LNNSILFSCQKSGEVEDGLISHS